LDIPARLPKAIIRRIQQTAVQAYRALCCEGMARVDFFLRPNGQVLVNEINTIPGFTKISMYPKMWQASGLSYSRLIDRLIALALERARQEKKLTVRNRPAKPPAIPLLVKGDLLAIFTPLSKRGVGGDLSPEPR